MRSNWRVARSMARSQRACCSPTPWLRSSADMPAIAFIGVRTSWLMLARNAVLARLEASAWTSSFVRSSSSWVCSSSSFVRSCNSRAARCASARRAWMAAARRRELRYTSAVVPAITASSSTASSATGQAKRLQSDRCSARSTPTVTKNG